MLTEESIVDSITARETGHIEVRRADRVLRDGEVIASQYHRHVLAPGDSLDGEDARVAAVASAVWTEEVLAAWAASQA